MKNTKLYIVSLIVLNFFSLAILKAADPAEELKNTRKLFKNASYSLKHLNAFTDSALALDNECYAKAYNAAGTMIGAKFEGNPFKKIKDFSKGKNALEEVIEANPENPEFRFIRLAVQLNIPKLLNYRDNIKEDTTLIKVFLNTDKHRDEDLAKMLKTFLELYSL
jgi:hypothetical protein